MAVTLAAVRRGLDSLDLKYHVIDATTIGLSQVGDHARLLVTVSLAEDGEYLRMRTIGFATCPRTHAKFAPAMAALADANRRFTAVCFGWDKNDGEIAGEVSLPLEDNTSLTDSQVRILYGLLVVSCDQLFETLEALLGRQEPTSLGTASGSAASPVRSTPVGGSGRKEWALLRWGIFLIGLAAVGGVVWLYLH